MCRPGQARPGWAYKINSVKWAKKINTWGWTKQTPRLNFELKISNTQADTTDTFQFDA